MRRNNYVPAVRFMATKQSRSSLYTPPTSFLPSFLPSHKLPSLLHFPRTAVLLRTCKSEARRVQTGDPALLLCKLQITKLEYDL